VVIFERYPFFVSDRVSGIDRAAVVLLWEREVMNAQKGKSYEETNTY
jgi:hypothetical protein